MKRVGSTVLIAALVLSGCAQIQRMEAERQANERAGDENQCSSFGYVRGTDAFADCMMAAAHRRDMARQDAARRDAEAREREKDRQTAKDIAAIQAQKDADTQRQIKQGEDLENSMARDAEKSMSPPAGSNCTTTTEVTQGTNAGSSSSTTICH